MPSSEKKITKNSVMRADSNGVKGAVVQGVRGSTTEKSRLTFPGLKGKKGFAKRRMAREKRET